MKTQTSTAKAALREVVRQRRIALEPEFVRLSNEAIIHRLIQEMEEYARARTLFCFVGTSAEIDTKPIILHALDEGKTVAVPLCTGSGIMEARQIFGIGELSPGGFGILEPRPESALICPQEIDFAVIPCLSCDRDCRRIGQGGGFYDRFMKDRGFFAAALCREGLMTDAIPTELWDLSVDAVVTETHIYRRAYSL